MKVKINTKNSEKILPVLRQWMQLKILEKTEDSITISGFDELVNLVLGELFFFKNRHPEIAYEVEHLK